VRFDQKKLNSNHGQEVNHAQRQLATKPERQSGVPNVRRDNGWSNRLRAVSF
jgi:hypothetical protein